jgi:GNAT superfamily N-acetyltransferase
MQADPIAALEWSRDEFRISTDPALLDLETIRAFLSASYWAPNVPEAVVRRSIEHSLAFGVYHAARQIGFARVISDHATFAYVSDVFIIPEYRSRKLGVWLIDVIMSHPDLQGLRRWMLATRDAHALYAKAGFTPLRDPSRWMELHRPGSYEVPE